MAEWRPGGLQCVAARVMSPDDWPGELGPDRPAACAALGIDPAGPQGRWGRPGGYGLVLSEDDAGGPWTTITSDAGLISAIGSLYPHDHFLGFEPDPRQVIETRPGWAAYPEAGAIPPDPGPGGRDPNGMPVDLPARRRSFADLVAIELAYLRGRTIEEYHVAWRDEEANWAVTDPEPPPLRAIDERRLADAGHPGAIPDAIAAIVALAERPELPAGTLRAGPAGPGPARLLRATGDTASLVARTDGPVVMLVDEAPGLLLEVPHDHPVVAEMIATLDAATRD